ncbi:TPA: hypothetical protein ACH3X2_013891 [Trebouxia sp. C0005]
MSAAASTRGLQPPISQATEGSLVQLRRRPGNRRMHAAVGPLYEVAQSPQMSEANWDPGYTHRETTNLANARLNKEQAMSSDPAKTDCREPHTRKMQRPNGPQHIRNYCIQKTNTFHYDFNAQAVRRRQKRLAASQPAPPPMFQQAQPADGKHHVGLQASSHQPDHLQHQVKQSQAAKQDTEQLYGALLCAARDEIAAEIECDSYSHLLCYSSSHGLVKLTCTIYLVFSLCCSHMASVGAMHWLIYIFWCSAL